MSSGVSPITDRRSEIWRESELARRLESSAATSTATAKLRGAGFVSEERLQIGFLTLSLSRQARMRPDGRHASRLGRVGRIAD